MKIRTLVIILFAFAGSILLHAESYSSKETFSRTGAFNPTGKIVFENTNGDVNIATWDKNEILIEGEKSAKTDEELKLIELTIELKEASAAIKVRLPKRSSGLFSSNNIRAAVRFKITVPATVSLEKINVVNGSVDIKGMRGSVTVESVNGRIRAHDLGGNVDLGAVNGEIDASLAVLSTGQKLSFHTVNGSITAALPADSGIELRASVVNGSIDCDFPVNVHGKVSGKRISGKVGDGRASLNAESVNGGIRIRKI